MEWNRKQVFCLVAILLVTAMAVSGIAMWLRQDKLEQLQNEALAELERNVGQYDEQSIVLYETSQAKAEKLAKLYGAKLRITKNGHFATLTLPEGTTIRDVYAMDESLRYIDQMAADYQVSVSELTEAERERPTQRPQYEASDTDYELQTYLDYLNLSTVWKSFTGYGVTVAVIDTGIDTDHPEFAGRISEYSYNATEDKIVKDYGDWSLIEDEVGHGTAVTGVLAASMNSGNVVGIAPEAEILVIKAACSDNGAFERTSDLVFGLYYAIERDVAVVNMSFVANTPDNPFAEATKLAYDSDIVCVAAAGNNATSMLSWPAADPYVIGVGALDGWALADYSNYGENVNICAPGTTYTTQIGGGYAMEQGTSQACPIVAGAIALRLQWAKYARVDDVWEGLYAAASDLGELGRDWDYGFGALDVGAMILEPRGTVIFDMLTDELEDMEGSYIQGHTLQELPEPERLYAIFDGWYYDDTCTQEYDYYVDKFYTEETTLYAKWVSEDEGIPFTYGILDDDTVEIRSYTGHRRYIVIPEKIEGRVVSSIGDFAFAGQTKLREITLPSGLVRIGEGAFQNCANLISIQFPENVTEIGRVAFQGNVRLSSIAFQGNSKLAYVGEYAFTDCARLQRIELPASLQRITGTAFSGTTQLQHIGVQPSNSALQSKDGVLFDITGTALIAFPAAWGTEYTLPAGTTRIGTMAFVYAKLKQIDLANVTAIEELAFAYAELESLTLPDSLTYLEEGAFSSNRKLSQVTLGRGLTVIPASTFLYTSSLKEIEIPSWITIIYDSAFAASGLEKAVFAEDAALISIETRAFLQCRLQEILIPSSVVAIGTEAFAKNPLQHVEFGSESNLLTIADGAFREAGQLQTITLPQSLQAIGSMAFANCGLTSITIPVKVASLGAGAFAWCPELKAIAVADGNACYHAIDGVVYDLENVVLCAYPSGREPDSYTVETTTRTIMPFAFAGAEKLRHVTLPEGMMVLGESSLCSSGIRSVTLPRSLEEIQDYAFEDCEQLAAIEIPGNVAQLGKYLFRGCWKLTEITFERDSKLQRIAFGTFAFCGITQFVIPANVSSVAQYAFEGCRKLQSIVFAENSKVESITAFLFDGCDALTRVSFATGSALKHIQAHAFEGLKKLEYVYISPDVQLKETDNFAFRCCPKLEYVGTWDGLPQTLQSIGRYAFFGCVSLRDLLLPESIEHVGSYAFLGCEELDVFFAADQMPAYLEENWDFGIRGYYVGVVAVEENETYQYAVLTSGGIAIVDYLGTAESVDLTQVDLGAPVTQIGSYAFRNSAVKNIVLPDTLTSIQAEAFAYSPLAAVHIPAGVKFIGREAFAYTPIATLTFANGSALALIEQYAFRGTKQLTAVSLPASITTLGTGVFMESGLQQLTFAEDCQLAAIPQKAFAQTKLTSVTLPDSVTLVDHNAFHNVQTLQKVHFGNNAGIRLMSNAFYHTGITSLHIPANVTYIGEYCFVGLSHLENFTVAEDNPNYKAEDGVLMSKNGRRLIAVPGAKTGSYRIPASVEVIGTGAFEDSALSEVLFHPEGNVVSISCRAFLDARNLTAITIPASVVSIDYYAFAYCEKLQTVTFAEGSKLKGIYEGAFAGCGALTELVLPDTVKEIAEFAFYGCRGLEKMPVPEDTGLMGVYDYAFAYSGIGGALTIPESVVYIGSYAFMETRITHLTVPDANRRNLVMGYGAFAACNRLEEMTLPFAGCEYYDEDHGVSYLFGTTGTPKSLKTITVTEGISELYSGAFTGLKGVQQLNLPHSITVVYGGALAGVEAEFTLTNTIQLVEANFAGSNLCGHLTLSGQTKEIPEYTFENCRKLESITLPEGLITIGKSAFEGCTSLKTIQLPDSLRELGDSAFRHCRALTGIRLPDGIRVIAPYTFEFCYALTQVDLPQNLEEISYNAFADCQSLEQIAIPDSVQSIRGAAFRDCGALAQIVIPEGITELEEDMFDGCAMLIRVTLPDSLQIIGYGVFRECAALTHITIPANVHTIQNSAFWGCEALASVHNLSGLDIAIRSEDHGGVALYAKRLTDAAGNCMYYTDGYESVQCLETEDQFLFEIYDGEYTLKSYLGDAQTITLPLTVMGQSYDIADFRGGQHVIVPEGFSEISAYAFRGCTSLHSITLPESLTSIGEYAFSDCWRLQEIILPESVTHIGHNAFENCGGLLSVRLPQNLKMVADHTFSDCWQLREVSCPEGLASIGDGAFRDCGQLQILQLPGSLQTIGVEAFAYCSMMQSIQLPQNLQSVGASAFANCYALTQIVIPESVTEVANGAFGNCEALRQVTICGDHTYFGAGIFSGCAEDVTFEILGKSAAIADGILYNGDMTQILYVSNTISGDLVLPDTLQSIGDGTFTGCTGLKSVVIPDSVTGIGDGAFRGCVNLEQLQIGNGVQTIGEDAFEGCTQLETVQIPDSVRSIGRCAFQNCTGLRTAHLGAGVQEIHLYYSVLSILNPFSGCENLEYVYVHEENDCYLSVDGILYDDVYDFVVVVPQKLKGEISLPEGLCGIDAGTFENCSGITGITLPATVTYVDDRAFRNCANLTYIQVAEENAHLFAYQGVLYERDPMRIVCVPQGMTGHLELAEGLQSLDYSFNGCNYLTGVTIPASVCRVTPGYYDIFVNCRRLETILVAEENSHFFAQDNILYSQSPVEIISLPGVIQNSIVLPEGLKEIRTRQFENQGTLVRITLPSTLTYIDWDAFAGCTHLFEVINHSGLDITGPWNSDHGGIGWYAKVIVDASNPEDAGSVGVNQTEDGFLYASYDQEYWLIAYLGWEDTITLPEDLEGQPYHISYFRGGKNIIIPGTVTSIDASAFAENLTLESVVIMDGVTYLGDFAFDFCRNLREVSIPGSIEQIYALTFQGCGKLAKVTLHEGIKAIGYGAFGDTCLTDVSLPSSLIYIGADALPTLSLGERQENWKDGVLAFDGWILAVREDVTYIPNLVAYRGAAADAYEGCNRLKVILWGGGGCAGAETILVRHLEDLDVNGIWDSYIPDGSYKNVVILEDIDLLEFYENQTFFSGFGDACIFVERAKDMARYDDNFPGWSGNSRVIYGGEWTWANFYDQEGKILRSAPRRNVEVILRPPMEDYTIDEMVYVFAGWDVDGDGLVDNLPATMITDLHAYPVYLAMSFCEAYGHQLLWHEGKETTCTEPGWQAYATCENCGHNTYIEQPALGHEYVDGMCTRCGKPEAASGDVNADGKVNARDARTLLRYLAGLITEEEIDLAAGDFNGDGKVNARDARAILRNLAGLDG